MGNMVDVLLVSATLTLSSASATLPLCRANCHGMDLFATKEQTGVRYLKLNAGAIGFHAKRAGTGSESRFAGCCLKRS